MPDRFKDLVPQPIPVQKITFDGLQRLILGLVLLLLVVISALLLVVGSLTSDLSSLSSQLDTVEQNQAEGQVRGIKIRAVSCQALAYLVVTDDLPDVCLEPAVLEFYDPERELSPDEGG